MKCQWILGNGFSWSCDFLEVKQCQGSKVVLLLKDPVLTAGGHVRNGTVSTACSFFRKMSIQKSYTCDLISHDKIWSWFGLHVREQALGDGCLQRYWAYLEDLMSRFITPTKICPSKEQKQGYLSIYRERSWVTWTRMLDILGQYPNLHKNRKSSSYTGATFSECSASCGHGLDFC